MYETVGALFTGICDAIRAKDGTTALIDHQDIPARIAAINGGEECIPDVSVPPFYASAGGLLINGGIVSGFNTVNAIYVGQAFRPLDKPWEIQVKFKTPSSFVHSTQIIFTSETYRGSPQITSSFQNNMQNLWFGVSTNNGSSWTISGWTDYQLLPETQYWIKVIFDGSEYIMYISTNGKDFDELKRHESDGNQFYQPETNNSFIFGAKKNNQTNIFDGSIDLKETYIKIDGNLWWGREK